MNKSLLIIVAAAIVVVGGAVLYLRDSALLNGSGDSPYVREGVVITKDKAADLQSKAEQGDPESPEPVTGDLANEWHANPI